MSKKSEIIFGIHPVIEAIQSGKVLDKILIKSQIPRDTVSELAGLARRYEVPLQYVPVEKLNRITGKNHQGVIAFLSLVEYHNIEQLVPMLFEQGKVPFVIILDSITDVRNFGAITRNAECAGVDIIVIPDTNTAQINAETVKSSAGALMHIPICRTKNMLSMANYLKNSGIKLIAADEKAMLDYTKISYIEPVAIIMGSEDTGISNTLLKSADQKVKIPLLGKIESLNVSSASAILMSSSRAPASSAV